MKFTCDRCGKETKVGKLALMLQCQACGSYDLRFDCSVEVFPMVVGGTLGKGVAVKNGESFYGLHPRGLGWVVKNHGELDSTIPSIVSESPEEIQKEDIKQSKKLKLAKAIRQLKSPIEVRGV